MRKWEFGSGNLEVGIWKSEVGMRKWEFGSGNLEVGSRNAEVGKKEGKRLRDGKVGREAHRA